MTDTNTSGADVLASLRGAVRIAKAASVGVTVNAPRIERAEKAIDTVAALIEREAALVARNAALERKTAVQMGVGDGACQLYVYGDYESIKAAQALVIRCEALAAEVKALRAERDAAMSNIHAEIAANLAFREAGGALPDEDMPKFCARLIAERKALRGDAERFTWQVAEWCRPQVTANMAIIEAYRTGDIDIIRAAIDAARASAATGGGNG